MRWGNGILTMGLLVCGACGVGPAPPIERYHMHGVVLSVNPQDHTATVKHDTITGFMEAMTMEYTVRDAKDLSAVKKGEIIDATVFVQDNNFWLGEIKEGK